MTGNTAHIEVNARRYRLPEAPLAVICIDGCADEYLTESFAQGVMPRTQQMVRQGYRGLVRGALPSFTNVNNTAIVTGCPPRDTGICGNFFIDPDSGEEVMMNDPKWVRRPTILAAAQNAGRRVAFVTAKDKLRRLLSVGLDPARSIAFSAERAADTTAEEHGISDTESLVGPAPEIYSPDASVYTLKAGVELARAGRADFMYLSLTDYMQHAYAPDQPESLAFYAELDEQIGRLLDLGCVVGITADHGMNAKSADDGSPNVLYLEDDLNIAFGRGHRVVCPITDPYVVHHGALGSAVWVHLPDRANPREVAEWILARPAVAEVYDRQQAALKLELDPARIGDLVVLAKRDAVIGRGPQHHDLDALRGTLRSHGGRYEEMVPMLLSFPLHGAHRSKAHADPRNFDIFDFTCNACP